MLLQQPGTPPFTDCLWLALQLAVEALEQEKQDLQSQIAQVLEGRQQLAHLKMSLSLEVATYRYRFTLTHPDIQMYTYIQARVEAPQLKASRAMGGGSSATIRFCDSRLIPFTPRYFPSEPT